MQPHVFERGRTNERRARSTHRRSPVLPRSNPFDLPRRRMFDSIAPVLRFLTLFALITAVATWVQVARQNSKAARQPADSPSATAQEQSAPVGKTAERPSKMPTAIGPVTTTPEAGTRVGRVRDNNDFAILRGDILPYAPAGDKASPSLPALAGANGVALPRVQTTEPPRAEVAESESADESRPEVARLPGFTVELPSR